MWLNIVPLLLGQGSCMHRLDWKLQSWECGTVWWWVNCCCLLNLRDGMSSEKCDKVFHIYDLDEESCKHIWYFSVRFLYPGKLCSEGKASACNAGDLGLIPGSGRSPRVGKDWATSLSWTRLKTAKPWGTSKGLGKGNRVRLEPRVERKERWDTGDWICSGSLVAGWPSKTGAGVSDGDSAELSFHASWIRVFQGQRCFCAHQGRAHKLVKYIVGTRALP